MKASRRKSSETRRASEERRSTSGSGPRTVRAPRDPSDLMERVAHGIRSPLGPLSHALTTLQAALGDTQEPRTQSAARMALRAISRLAHMADRLDLAAEIERGQVMVQVQPVDLASLVRQQLERSELMEGRPEVQLVSELAESLWLSADPTKIRRAIGELVGNGLRHARRSVRVCLRQDDRSAILDVEDDGLGVAENGRSALLDPSAPRTNRSGLSLGLDIAREVARAHGGSLAIGTSSLPPFHPGTTGARFTLVLPVEPAAR